MEPTPGRHFKRVVALCATLAATVALQRSAVAQGYSQTNLVSDIPGLAATTDPNLINPWGVSSSATSPFWVSDNGPGLSTLYNTAGSIIPLVVTIPPPTGGTGAAAPTGQVFNGTSDFEVSPGNPALFIFATEDGTISGWNPSANATNAILMVDRSGVGAVYKGLAMARVGKANYLYAANFHSGQIDVFDHAFNPTTFPGKGVFQDPRLPAGYAPFNIQNIGGNLYVAYAQQQPVGIDEMHGFRLGYVDIYNTRGQLAKRLQNGWWMNAPWGIAIAPSTFGDFAGDILVGNFGGGWISAFDPKTYRFVGLLSDHYGYPIIIDGLWALIFGNGGKGGDPNTLYFTAGLNNEVDGLFGSLQPVP